jgi:membrane-associated phospholipid phosphatase
MTVKPVRITLALLFVYSISQSTSFAQPPEPDQTPPPAASPAAQPPPDVDRPVSLKRLLPNLLDDQKRIWTFPARLVEGHNWIPTAAVLGTTAALIALDPVEGGYFRRTTAFHGFNSVFSSNATQAGVLIAPAAFYAVGLVRKDPKMQKTALFAAEALGDAEILLTVLKDSTNRLRPSSVPPNGNFSDTFFERPPRLVSSTSFPSGHAISAFAVATVIARRYGNHHWVPYAAYGGAALVGFSRLTLSAHFTSDVFMGAALGYCISRFVVLHE